MSKTSFEQVREFHEKFNHPIYAAPFVPDDKTVKLRLALILEELTELTEACLGDTDNAQKLLETLNDAMERLKVLQPTDLNVDLVGVADALTDIMYVVCGAGHACGLNLDACMEEVHRSNMSKLDADGKPKYNEQGKVMKGPNYVPPNLENVLWKE